MGLADNSLKAYRASLGVYRTWCERHGVDMEAWDPADVRRYLAEGLGDRKMATIAVFRSAVTRASAAAGVRSPFSYYDVEQLYNQLKAQKKSDAARFPHFTRSDVHDLADHAIGDTELKRVRDRAIFLVAHYCDLRREEIAGLDVSDMEAVIPEIGGRYCPLAATRRWLRESAVKDGPLFRSVDKHGRVDDDRLTGKAIINLVKEVAPLIGKGRRYNAESLRPRLPAEQRIEMVKDRVAAYRRERDSARLQVANLQAALLSANRRIEHLLAKGQEPDAA